MRILFVTPHYYPYIGGVEYVVKSTAERLSRKGWEVTVLCGEPGARKPLEEAINGVRVIRWPTWAPGGAYHIPKRRGELGRLLGDLTRDVDVVHIHSVHAAISVYAGLRLVKQRRQVVVTPYYHGSGHTAIRRILWRGWRVYVGRLLASASAVHTVSRLEARLVKEHFGLEATPIENGVEEWIPDVEWRPRGYVMYSGRIEKYKNIHRLARIVSLLNKYGHDLYLKILGKGP
ncbi:MAG: glycosyltransferase family 4 protein [Infirmifilum sp.]